MPKAMRVAEAVLSLGLSEVIRRYGGRLTGRLRAVLWALIAANEIRGLIVVYEFGGMIFKTSLRAFGLPI